MRSDPPPPERPRDQDHYVPPPPQGFQPNSLRGVLYKQEDSVLGRKKWTKKVRVQTTDMSRKELRRIPAGNLVRILTH